MKFVYRMIASSLAIPAVCHAVGLGPIHVQSALNQPFDASIELLSLRNIPLTGIKATLAGDQEFDIAGLARPHYLEQIHFSVEKDKQGKPVIHLTTDQRVSEPYLKFLIDVSWSEGQFFREYTVLLDPVSYHVENQRPVKVKHHPEHPLKKAEAPTIAKPSRTEALTYGPTKQSDNLYQIAVQFRPSDAVSVGQTMLAIFAMNPEAFRSGNINGLKSGVVLNIPSDESMMKGSPAEARDEVQRQNLAWAQGMSAPQTTATATATAIATEKDLKPKNSKVDQSIAQNENKPRVAELPTELKHPVLRHQDMVAELFLSQNDLGMNIEQSDLLPTPPESIRQEANAVEDTLRTELAVTAEAVSAIKQANVDLQQQLVDLQAKNSKLSKAMESRDQELNELRKTLALNAVKATVTQVPAIESQSFSQSLDETGVKTTAWDTNRWISMTLLLLSAASSGLYFWFRRQQQAPALWIDPQESQLDQEEDEYRPEVSTQQEASNDYFMDLETLSGEDLVSSKLDLATAYVGMDDHASARELLNEVMTHGSIEQRREAQKLLNKMA